MLEIGPRGCAIRVYFYFSSVGPTKESHETLLERESAMVGKWDSHFADMQEGENKQNILQKKKRGYARF